MVRGVTRPGVPKRDWYVWRPAREGFEPGTPGAEPTNWGSFFGGSAWQYDEASGEYYLHLFSRKQPDLNWENPEVRAAVHDMMNWWVDRGVDGFRMDVINLISKTHPLTDGAQLPGQPYSFEVERVANGPRLVEFLEEMNRAVGLSEKQLFTVGEMVACGVQHAREYTSRRHDRLNMVFTFEHVMIDQGPGGKLEPKPLHLPDLKKNLALWQAGLASDGWNSLYFENHDQPRSVSRFGDDSDDHRVASAKALATVLHLHEGTPYVYQGQEIGIPNAGFTTIEQYADIEALGQYRQAVEAGADAEALLVALGLMSRDNARTPMPWTPQGGFTDGTPWLPMNPTTPTINVETDAADPDGVIAYYRELISLRHDLPVVQTGRFELLLPEDERLWVFTRTLGDQQILVIANMTSSLASVPMAELPAMEDARLLLANVNTGHDLQTLQPWETRVYELAV
nr:alpha-amylase family glycosyl hydrolase [Propioniciclava coleopterorum]